MARIRPLPRSVIQAIAAGEIVEKPAIVVKELIENSLDAKASQIDILIENGGLERMTVSDNGEGMDETDLLLSFQRHTTSKIHDLPELSQISTLGFRGEALASIASASRLTIQSRSKQAVVGQRVVVEQDEVREVTPVGMPVGTVVTVEALFHHLPARRKFLRKPAAEFREVLEVVTRSALSHPQVSFSLTHNQKPVFRLPAQQTLTERVQLLMGGDIHEHVVPVIQTTEHISLQGVVGKPQAARRSSQKQYLFVNGRPVHHPPFSAAVAQSFGSLIEPRAYPIFVLNITLPPDQVDINIHPRKETLKFLNEKTVLEFVEKAITQTLADHNLTFMYRGADSGMDRTASVQTAKVLKEIVEPWLLSPQSATPEILQLHKTYLVTQTARGFMIIDQHAAHERILYEQFLEAFTSSADAEKMTPTALATPQQLSFSVAEAQVLEDHLETFHSLGFELEKFGETSFKISHAPLLFHDRDFQQLFQEIIDDLESGKPVKLADSVALRTIAYLACRQAVKAGDALTPEQRRQLVEKLAETPNNTNCPHGRPTTITFSVRDLEVLFKRR